MKKAYVGVSALIVWVGAVGMLRGSDAATAPSTQPQNLAATPRVDLTYQDVLAHKVDDLVAGASGASAESVAAEELKLPRAALPLLQAQLDRKDLAAGAIKAIKAALDADSARVQFALAQKKELDWYHKQMLEAFDSTVAPDAPWRKAARTTVEAWEKQQSEDPSLTQDEDAIIWKSSDEADAEGCDDPLFLCARALNLPWHHANWDKTIMAALRANEQMQTSSYPAYFKFKARLIATEFLSHRRSLSDEDRKTLAELLSHINTNFPQAIADPDLPRVAVYELFNRIGDTSLAINKDRGVITLPLFGELEKSKVDRSTVLGVEGTFYVYYAWDARGGGEGDTITADGQKLMTERLEKAAALLEQSWAQDHSNYLSAAEMIQAEIGQGQGRDRMELWFKRATDADPSNYAAHYRKFRYLLPDWYGDQATALKFAQSASDAAPPDSELRLLVVLAQGNMSRLNTEADGRKSKRDYFENNPAAWDDIHHAFDDYLACHPDSYYQFMRYAKQAVTCGHRAEAYRAFCHIPPDTLVPEFYRTIDAQKRYGRNLAGKANMVPE